VVLGVKGGHLAGGKAVHCSYSLCCMRGIKERQAWPTVYVPALCMYCCAQLEVDWWWSEGARLLHVFFWLAFVQVPLAMRLHGTYTCVYTCWGIAAPRTMLQGQHRPP
jgi:hypothetical protein